MGEILRLNNLEVSFSGFKAIDGVNLSVEEGELRVIIGPNGAGKTTLMDLITGKTKPSCGTVYFDGKNITGKTSYEIAGKSGIGRKFQSSNVFDNMTVMENLEVALSGSRDVGHAIIFRQNKAVSEKLEELLEQINLTAEKDEFACFLSHGQRQWLEIGMVIAQQPKMIILDEPTAGMTASETYQTGELINSLKGKRTILVVEHDMDFVKQVANQVTVMHMGKIFEEGTFEEISSSEKVIQIYLKSDVPEAV